MKRLLVLMVCFMFLSVGTVFAKAGERHRLEVANEISYIKYEEPDIMEEDGVMYGIAGVYTYHNNDVTLTVDARYSYGQVDYTSSNTGSMDDIDDYMIEVRGSGGYEFSPSKTVTFTPYIGLGYRYLNDDSGGMTSSTGHVGYERESNYFYSPIGAEILADLQNKWFIGIIFEYDIFWQGEQKSHLSDVALGYGDLENTQDDGYGVRGSLKFIRKAAKIDFIIEPFIRYWDIEQSEESAVTYSGVIIGRGYEPENNSTEYGIKAAVRF